MRFWLLGGTRWSHGKYGSFVAVQYGVLWLLFRTVLHDETLYSLLSIPDARLFSGREIEFIMRKYSVMRMRDEWFWGMGSLAAREKRTLRTVQYSTGQMMDTTYRYYRYRSRYTT